MMQSLGSFGWAIDRLKDGAMVGRSGWNGKGMYIKLQVPDENSKMSLPYIYMKTVDDKLVPWLASQTDVLCDDWEEVAETFSYPIYVISIKVGLHRGIIIKFVSLHEGIVLYAPETSYYQNRNCIDGLIRHTDTSAWEVL